MGETETAGKGFTITVIKNDAVQPKDDVPVTEYVVVVEGVAITLGPEAVFNEEDGYHPYDTAPLALSVTDCPAQIVCVGDTVIRGRGSTFNTVVAVAVHPFALPTTV